MLHAHLHVVLTRTKGKCLGTFQKPIFLIWQHSIHMYFRSVFERLEELWRRNKTFTPPLPYFTKIKIFPNVFYHGNALLSFFFSFFAQVLSTLPRPSIPVTVHLPIAINKVATRQQPNYAAGRKKKKEKTYLHVFKSRLSAYPLATAFQFVYLVAVFK